MKTLYSKKEKDNPARYFIIPKVMPPLPGIYEMTKPEKNGHTFILHLWREKADGLLIWRGSITDIQNGEKKYFQSMQGLADLLARLLESGPMAGLGGPKINSYED